jgi:hypothetical protein
VTGDIAAVYMKVDAAIWKGGERLSRLTLVVSNASKVLGLMLSVVSM